MDDPTDQPQPTQPNDSLPPTEPTVWEFIIQSARQLFKHGRFPTVHALDTLIPGQQISQASEETSVVEIAETPPALSGEFGQPTVSYQVAADAAENEGGTRVQISVTLPPGTKLHMTLSAQAGDKPVDVQVLGSEDAGQVVRQSVPAARQKRLQWPSLPSSALPTRQRLRSLWRWDLPTTLFGLALIIYLLTHLIGLLRYPIYFFSDEAMQPLFAENILKNHLMDTRDQIFLPLYVEVDGNRWAPLLPMYFHAVTMTLFGKTALVTRATSAIFSILAAISVSLLLKRVFKARFWWAGALVLAVTPAWFLHSRTAFETVSATTFYALFLWLYLRYRTDTPRAIFPAAICAAGAFYSYSNAQAVLALTVLLLLLTDLPYHMQQWRTLVWLIPLGVVLAMPLAIFEWRNPDAISTHLRIVDSYWFHDIPLSQKLTTLLQKYSYGLSPQYWFFSNSQDLERHRFGPYAHILTIFLPFFLIGLIVCLRKVRSAPERIILLAAFSVPAGAAQLDIGVPRVLMFVVPASVLIVLGWEWLWQLGQHWLSRKPIAETITHWALFYVLAFGSLFLLGNALENGALWFRNYGLYGMQYGAVQLFDEEIPRLLYADPETMMIVSPTWANGTHRFADFFLSPEQRARVRMGNIDAYLSRKLDLPASLLFIMTPEELAAATTNPKLSPPTVEKTLNYPNGEPGFYFVHWAYSPEADSIFAAEKAERMQLIKAEVILQDQTVMVRHSWIDMGQPQEMFDGDRFTLMRGLEANPLIIELDFPEVRTLSGISADFGAQDTTITATLTVEGLDEPIQFAQSYYNVGDPQVLELPFEGGPYRVISMHLEFLAMNPGDEVHIHVRELNLLP